MGGDARQKLMSSCQAGKGGDEGSALRQWQAVLLLLYLEGQGSVANRVCRRDRGAAGASKCRLIGRNPAMDKSGAHRPQNSHTQTRSKIQGWRVVKRLRERATSWEKEAVEELA